MCSSDLGDEALAQRPLTILTIVYRLWARVRLDQSESWLASCMHPCCAATTGRTAEDIWARLAQRIEVNQKRDAPHRGLSLDLQQGRSDARPCGRALQIDVVRLLVQHGTASP